MKKPVTGMIRVLGAVLLCGIGVGMSGCDSFSLEFVLPDGDGCFQQDVVETQCYLQEILVEECFEEQSIVEVCEEDFFGFLICADVVIDTILVCEDVVIEVIEVCEDVVVDSFIVCE